MKTISKNEALGRVTMLLARNTLEHEKATVEFPRLAENSQNSIEHDKQAAAALGVTQGYNRLVKELR